MLLQSFSPAIASASCFLSSAVSITIRPTFFASALNLSQSPAARLPLPCTPTLAKTGYTGWRQALRRLPASHTVHRMYTPTQTCNYRYCPISPYAAKERNLLQHTQYTRSRLKPLLNIELHPEVKRSWRPLLRLFLLCPRHLDVVKKPCKYFNVSFSPTSTTGPPLPSLIQISKPASCHFPPARQEIHPLRSASCDNMLASGPTPLHITPVTSSTHTPNSTSDSPSPSLTRSSGIFWPESCTRWEWILMHAFWLPQTTHPGPSQTYPHLSVKQKYLTRMLGTNSSQGHHPTDPRTP